MLWRVNMMSINCLDQGLRLTDYSNFYYYSLPFTYNMTTYYSADLCYKNSHTGSTRLVSLCGWQTAFCQFRNKSNENAHFWQLDTVKKKLCPTICPSEWNLWRGSLCIWLIDFIYWEIIHSLMGELWKIIAKFRVIVKGSWCDHSRWLNLITLGLWKSVPKKVQVSGKQSSRTMFL